MTLKITVVLMMAACLLIPDARPQDITPPAKRTPTIGLALEGGGALGLAHVGLLEWLAQNHVPVDYIAGTSMGGLVAGFYASGMTPEAMHRLVATLDWDRLVGGEKRSQTLSFRRKEDIRKLGDETVVGLRHNLILPIGFNSGEELDFLLSRVAAPYDQLRSFDDLPTPFRCVATDLGAARAHVFDRGSLAKAMRATMSIPGLFDPVIDGNQEYVDGGLLDNLPVDLVKAMGADVVIAVYLTTDPFDPQKPQSLLKVLDRSLSTVIAAQERHNIAQADLLVNIDLTGLQTGDFSDYSEIIQRGFAGAQKRQAVLAKFALNDTEWSGYQERRIAKTKTAVATPAFVQVTGVDPKTAEDIRSYFAKDIGQPFRADLVERQISQAMGNGAFAYMAYDVVQREGRTGLAVYVRPSPSKPPTLQPALLVDGSDYRDSRFAAAARLTYQNLGGFRSEWRTGLIAGSTYGLNGEYFRPFTPLSNWFLAPQVFASTRPLDFYRRSDLLALYRERDAGAGLDVGYEFANRGEVRFGYQASYVATSYRLGDTETFPVVHGRSGAGHLSYVLDDVDEEVVPHRGVLARSNFRWIDANPGTPETFPAFDGNTSAFLPLSGLSTIFISAEGGTIFNRRNSGIPLFYLGGPQRLSAYGWNELYGNEYAYGRLGYLKQLAVLSPLTNSKAYFLIDYEVGKMYGFPNSTQVPMDVNAGLLAKTPLGPLFLGGSVGDSGHRKWYFQLGPVF